MGDAPLPIRGRKRDGVVNDFLPRKREGFAVRDLTKLTRGRRGQVGASGCVVVKLRCVSVSLRTVFSAA